MDYGKSSQNQTESYVSITWGRLHESFYSTELYQGLLVHLNWLTTLRATTSNINLDLSLPVVLLPKTIKSTLNHCIYRSMVDMSKSPYSNFSQLHYRC